MLKNRSGQYVYFTLVSSLSGNPVTGASGSISGRKSLDGLSGMIVLSGNIIELGGGSYRANLYDFDTNGDQAGYLFTASGCVPIQYQFDMLDGNGSGRIYIASGSITSGLIASGTVFVASGASTVATLYSGQLTLPYSGSLSGQVVVAASGVFSTASLNSGQSVLVYSGQLSGQPVTLASGTTFLASGSITSGVIVSGVYVNAATTVASGISVVASLYSGQLVSLFSGSFSGQPVNATATVNSGLSVIATLYSGSLSGQQVDVLTNLDKSGYVGTVISGTTYVNSGYESRLLAYDFSGLSVNSGTRCLLNANRKLINRWDLSTNSGYLTVYQEDDSSTAYKQAVTITSGAEPVTGLDT